ncbi:MAG: R3H domain-containing nucleic acid-binding protein [Myxococcota bacterium]
MAQEAAQHVREDGEPQLLPAMNSKERWVVHNTLKSETGIRSQSEGEGPMRRVKILPA